jgi:hypothetical protein
MLKINAYLCSKEREKYYIPTQVEKLDSTILQDRISYLECYFSARDATNHIFEEK